MAPEADNRDGLLDLCTAGELTRPDESMENAARACFASIQYASLG
jgi:hypothetical protein